ncbi:MAG: hypothetical protein HQK65_20810 [Desulfamplus sp.]|nr:hypothetical protein [Desulfamplus sp.]
MRILSFKYLFVLMFVMESLYLSHALSSSFDNAPIVALNTAYKGNISVPGEQDWYRFNVEPNKRYYIIVWADNTFGTVPTGLKDTQLRAYLEKGSGEIFALNNTDAPIELNLGYGSSIFVETVPVGVTPIKPSHCVAPSTVKFFIEQQDLPPETGSYSFKIFVDDMPRNASGSYDYHLPIQNPLLNGPVNPPAPGTTVDAPVSTGNDKPANLSIVLSTQSGNAPLSVTPRVFLDGVDVTAQCEFSYGDSLFDHWVAQKNHVYMEPGSYQVKSRYIQGSKILTTEPVTVYVEEGVEYSIKDFDFNLTAIDVSDELVLQGSSGVHVYIWFSGNTIGQPVEQYFVYSMYDKWYALDAVYQWHQLDVSSNGLYSELPVFKTAPLDNDHRETVFSAPDYMLPSGEIDYFYCIDNKLDGTFSLESSECKRLRLIKHLDQNIDQ